MPSVKHYIYIIEHKCIDKLYVYSYRIRNLKIVTFVLVLNFVHYGTHDMRVLIYVCCVQKKLSSLACMHDVMSSNICYRKHICDIYTYLDWWHGIVSRRRFRRLRCWRGRRFRGNFPRRWQEVAPAHWARPVRVQPHVDALDVEQVLARRQLPHHIADLDVLEAHRARLAAACCRRRRHRRRPGLEVGGGGLRGGVSNATLVGERRQRVDGGLRHPEPALLRPP